MSTKKRNPQGDIQPCKIRKTFLSIKSQPNSIKIFNVRDGAKGEDVVQFVKGFQAIKVGTSHDKLKLTSVNSYFRSLAALGVNVLGWGTKQ